MKNNSCKYVKKIIAAVLLAALSLTLLPATTVFATEPEGGISQLNSWTLSTFDNRNAYSGSSAYKSVRHEALTSGDSCLVGQSSSDPKAPNIIHRKLPSPIDASDAPLSELYLSLDLYVENPSLISNGQVEISSSGKNDVEELMFVFKSGMLGQFVLKPGWNSVVLPLNTAASTGGTLRWDHIDFFRIYFVASASMTVKMNNLCLLQVPPHELDESFEKDDAQEKWSAQGATLRQEDGSLLITMTEDRALISSDAYAVALATPDTYLLCADWESNTALTAADLVLGQKDALAEYHLPTNSSGEYAAGVASPDLVAAGFAGYPQADTVGLRLQAPRGTQIRLHSIAILGESTMVERRIDAIGEITMDNYLHKQSLLDAASESVSAYLAKVTVNYITRTVRNYYVYVDACARMEHFRLCEAAGILTDLTNQSEDASAGEEIVLSLQLCNVGEADLFDYRYRVNVGGTDITLYSQAEMAFHLPAGQSSSFDLYLCAQAGGQYPVTVTLLNNLGEEIGIALQTTLVISGEGYYIADSHTHSVGSDGKYTIADNAYSAYHNGSLLFYATDHNANPGVMQDLEQAQRVMESAGYDDMIILKGNEVTSMVKGAGHLLHYGTSTYYPAPSDTNNETNYQLFLDIMDAILAEGGYCYIAHPYLSTWPFYGISETPKNIDVFTNFTGVEIFNAGQNDTGFAESMKAIEYWDRMNIKGDHKYFAIGNSDGHTISSLNTSQSVFILPELSEHAYNNALGNGTFYATCGPDLRFTINGANMGESIIVGKDGSTSGTVHVTAYDELSPLTEVRLIHYTMSEDNDAAYRARKITELFSDAKGTTRTHRFDKELELELKPGEFYRLEVTSLKHNGANRMACSNPIWVTTAATSLHLDRAVSLSAGNSLMLNIATDNVYDSLVITSSDPDAVTVYDNGRVEAAADAHGVYTLHLTTTGGSQYSTIRVYVDEPITDDDKPDEQLSGVGSCTVRIDLAGGSADYALLQKISTGKTLTELRTPVKAGHRFLGFYADPQGEMLFDFSEVIDHDLTLYARWEQDDSQAQSKLGIAVAVGLGIAALAALATIGIVLTARNKKKG